MCQRRRAGAGGKVRDRRIQRLPRSDSGKVGTRTSISVGLPLSSRTRRRASVERQGGRARICITGMAVSSANRSRQERQSAAEGRKIVRRSLIPGDVVALSMPEDAASVTRSQITCGSGVAASTAGGNDTSASPCQHPGEDQGTHWRNVFVWHVRGIVWRGSGPDR